MHCVVTLYIESSACRLLLVHLTFCGYSGHVAHVPTLVIIGNTATEWKKNSVSGMKVHRNYINRAKMRKKKVEEDCLGKFRKGQELWPNWMYTRCLCIKQRGQRIERRFLSSSCRPTPAK